MIEVLIHGDCLDEMKKMADNSVDFAFTSPPYNRKRNDKYDHYEDVVDDYYGWMCNTIDELIRVTKGNVFFNIQKNFYNKKDVFNIIGKYSDVIQEIIVWEKTNPMPASGGSITNSHEYIIVFGDEALVSNNTYTKNIITTSVNSNMPKNHKAVMHREVSDWIIKNFTSEEDTVLDCFMGTATTGMSCKSMGRGFVGIELNDTYFNMSIDNMDNTKQSNQVNMLKEFFTNV
jgi:site-specific DNA-methyltransferase (adenine-specific)